MLEFLRLKQQTLPSKDKLLLIRDGLLISVLWQSCFRGFNVAELRLEDIRTPTNSPPMTHCPPASSAAQFPAALLQMSPKTGKVATALSPSAEI